MLAAVGLSGVGPARPGPGPARAALSLAPDTTIVTMATGSRAPRTWRCDSAYVMTMAMRSCIRWPWLPIRPAGQPGDHGQPPVSGKACRVRGAAPWSWPPTSPAAVRADLDLPDPARLACRGPATCLSRRCRHRRAASPAVAGDRRARCRQRHAPAGEERTWPAGCGVRGAGCGFGDLPHRPARLTEPHGHKGRRGWLSGQPHDSAGAGEHLGVG
jgi:hypothetical protein